MASIRQHEMACAEKTSALSWRHDILPEYA
jgi:hypothetical protein